MFASVLGMALSIAFGISNTYAIGVAFYVVCGAMIAVTRSAGHVSQDDVDHAVSALAPSIQPTLDETAARMPEKQQA